MKNLTPVLVAFAFTTGSVHGGNDPSKTLRAILIAESYSFTVHGSEQGAPVEAAYKKDMPLYCKADNIEFFRKDKLLVYKQGESWQRTRTGTLSDPLRILGASAKVRAVRLPHDELAILGKAVGKVEQKETLFAGTFGAEDAKKLARVEDVDLARDGAARLWIDGNGRLTKYEISIRMQGRRGNADVDGNVKRTVTLANVNSTMFNVPADAKKLLE